MKKYCAHCGAIMKRAQPQPQLPSPQAVSPQAIQERVFTTLEEAKQLYRNLIRRGIIDQKDWLLEEISSNEYRLVYKPGEGYDPAEYQMEEI